MSRKPSHWHKTQKEYHLGTNRTGMPAKAARKRATEECQNTSIKWDKNATGTEQEQDRNAV